MLKKIIPAFVFLLVALHLKSQEYDTLVDVGGYRLHFHIVKGKGLPILFDAGGGNDGTVWKDLLQPIHQITGATLITYDRPGFGKSEIDRNNNDMAKHGIQNGIEALETGLRKLRYAENIFLVAHSYGGFYAALYAARHPLLVSGAVLVDASHACWFTDGYLNSIDGQLKTQMEESKTKNPGMYYQSGNLAATVTVIRKNPFPATIPVTDLVAERPPFGNATDDDRWKECHLQFVEGSPKRKTVTAKNCGHYIFVDNPPLVIQSIVELYAGLQSDSAANAILQRGMAYSISASNKAKDDQSRFMNSEDDINNWGYVLLNKKDFTKAIEVFKLNAFLYPASYNVFDSLGEAYENAGNKEEAIKNYSHSLELNPKNSNAAEHLKKLKGS